MKKIVFFSAMMMIVASSANAQYGSKSKVEAGLQVVASFSALSLPELGGYVNLGSSNIELSASYKHNYQTGNNRNIGVVGCKWYFAQIGYDCNIFVAYNYRTKGYCSEGAIMSDNHLLALGISFPAGKHFSAFGDYGWCYSQGLIEHKCVPDIQLGIRYRF